jgi:hypothetical protein
MMSPVEIVKGIGALLWFGAGIIFALFVNFLLRRQISDGILGLPISSSWIHAVLGPVLLVVNGMLLVYLCALYDTRVEKTTIAQIQSTQIKWIFGPLCNPFFLGKYRLLNSCGYAFLIILWWLGMHTFLYSTGLNPQSKWVFGWQTLISVMFLALGLASMLAIQGCWRNFGMADYRLKWIFGSIGIPIGAFLPPILLRLGLPKILR